MEKYIDPLYDIGFKLTMGREHVSEDILKGFLNAIFSGDPVLYPITHLRYLNNERSGDWKDAKGIRYDIMCETSTHHRFIVEMQKAPQRHFIKRSIYYVCRGIAEQGYKGRKEYDEDWDYDITPVVGVFLCNFHVPTLPFRTLVKARLEDDENKEPIGDEMRLVFIQLPSFNKGEAECESEFDQWIYNLKNMGQNQAVAFQDRNDIFRKLADISTLATLSPEERRDYEADVKLTRDRRNQMKYAIEEAVSQGMAQGMAQGIEKIARRMKEAGKSIEEIQSLTGLDIDQIHSL